MKKFKTKGKILASWITNPLPGKLLDRNGETAKILKGYTELWIEWKLYPNLKDTIHYYELPGKRLVIWNLSKPIGSREYLYCINRDGKIITKNVRIIPGGYLEVDGEIYSFY